MPKKYLDASSVNGEVWKTIHLESRDMQDDNWRAGVFLRSKSNNQRVWIQHVKIEGHKREILIGEFPDVSMAQARKLAAKNRELVETGIDILSKKRHDNDRRLRDQLQNFSKQDDLFDNAIVMQTSAISFDEHPESAPDEELSINQAVPFISRREQKPQLPLLDLTPYAVPSKINENDGQWGMSKAVFAEQIEKIIALEGHSDNYENLDAPTSLEFFKAAKRSGKADRKADDAGPNIKVLSKALILNAISADQTNIIRATFADMLEDHGPEVLDAACAQALAFGRSSLTSVAAIISNETDDTPDFQPNTTDAITHTNIRGAGYFN